MEGRRKYNLGHWRDAITSFERAYAISGDPALLFNLAQAHRQAGNPTDAIRLFKAFLRERPDGPDSDTAQKQITDLERQHLPATIPSAATSPAAAVTVIEGPKTPQNLQPAIDPSPPPQSLSADISGRIQSSEQQVDVDLPVPRWMVWTAAATTVALAGAAIVTTSAAASRFQELKNTCGQTDIGCTSDQVASLKSRDKVATALWSLTALAATGTSVVVFADARRADLSALWRF